MIDINKSIADKRRLVYETAKRLPILKVKKIGAYFIFLLSLLYFVSPVDLIPDVIPIAGWVDDLTFLTFALLNLIEKGFLYDYKRIGSYIRKVKWIIFFAGLTFTIVLVLLTIGAFKIIFFR